MRHQPVQHQADTYTELAVHRPTSVEHNPHPSIIATAEVPVRLHHSSLTSCAGMSPSGDTKSFFHLPCYFYEMNSSHLVDEPRYCRRDWYPVAGFAELHPVDQDLVRRLDMRHPNNDAQYNAVSLTTQTASLTSTRSFRVRCVCAC